MSNSEKLTVGFKKALSTIKAVALPVSDTISDLYLITVYSAEGHVDRAITLLVIFFIAHITCCCVIYQRIRKKEAKAVWKSPARKLLFTLATLVTLGPVVLKLVEIYGKEDRVHGARKPTCYSKLTLCFLECLPQFVLNIFYICNDGCCSVDQIVSLSISVAAACYAVQRYTNPANERLSRPIENTIHTMWLFCVLLGNVLPFAIVAGLVSPVFLLTGFIAVYGLTFLMLCRAVLVNLLVLDKVREQWRSFQGFLYKAFIRKEKEKISRNFDVIFISTASLSLCLLLVYLAGFFWIILFYPDYPKLKETIETCDQIVVYKSPLLLLCVSFTNLVVAYCFFFFVILNDWVGIQNKMYRLRAFVCFCCDWSSKGYDTEPGTNSLAVPGELTDIQMTISGQASDLEGAPQLKNKISRTVSTLDYSQGYISPTVAYVRTSGKEIDALRNPQSGAPRSLKMSNYSDHESNAELVSYKQRSVSIRYSGIDDGQGRLTVVGKPEDI